MPTDNGGGGALGHTLKFHGSYLLKFQLTVDVLNFKNCQNIQTLSYPYRIRML